MDFFDIVIVGAGIAGSALARLLAEKGWSVLLIEKEVSPGQRVACGGLFAKKYCDMFVTDESILEQHIKRIDFIFPWGTFSSDDSLITAQRRKLDLHLALNAQKGGAFLLTSCKVIDYELVKSGEVRVTVKNLTTMDIIYYKARICVFADGPFSLAKKNPRFDPRSKMRYWSFALVYEMDGRMEESDVCKIYLDKDLVSWGYGWIFPNRDQLNVGIGTVVSLMNKRVNLRNAMHSFIQQHHLSSRYLKNLPVRSKNSGTIPMHLLKNCYADSQVVIGDAAGMVSPLFGAGIDNSFEAALMLADVLDQALHKRDYSEKALIKYKEKLQGGIYSELRKQNLIAKIIIASMRANASFPTKLLSIIAFGARYSRWNKLKVLFYPACGMPEMMK